MADFEALIKAKLDTTGIDGQIKSEIESKSILFKDVRLAIDERLLRSSIENALSNSFNININPTFNNRDINNAGRNLGRQINDAMNSAVNTGLTRAGADRLESLLGNHSGLDESAISRTMQDVVRNVGNANISIQRMSETFQSATDKANGLRNFRIEGIDEAGSLVNIMTQVNAETGEVIRTTTTLTQRFDQVAESANNTQYTFNRLLQVQKQIESVNLASMRLDPEKNANEIQVLQSVLRSLREEYINLFTSSGPGFSDEQFRRLTDAAQDSENKIVRMQASLDDTSGVKTQTDALQKLYDLRKKMDSISLTSETLDSKKNANQLKTLQQQFDDAEKEYNELRDLLQMESPDIDFSKVDQEITDFENKLSVLRAKIQDEVAIESEKQSNIDAAKAESDALQRLYDLRKKMDQVGVKIEKLDASENINQLAELEKQFDEAEAEYQDLRNTLQLNSPTVNFDKVDKEVENYKSKIAEVKAAHEDAIQKSAKEIELKISTKDIDVDISNVARRINELKAFNSGDIVNLGLDDDLADLQELRSSMNNLNGTQLVNAYDDLNTLLDTIKNKLAIISNENKNVVSSLQVTTLDNKMKTWLEKNTKASKDFGASIESLRARLKAASESGEVSKEVYDKINREFNELTQSAIAAGKAGQSLGDKLKKAFSGIFGVVSVASVLRETVNVLKDMYQEVYDIDTAMVSLKKVTDETDSRYNTFLKDAATSAKGLGRSVSSLVEQSATWAKLGYSIDQAEELAKLSSIYANVAEVDDKTAVSDIVTALKAFKMETDEAERVVDSLNDLGNKFATDAASLGQGLSNSASAMSVAGADMYETLAMITGITEITQDASGAGNMLKIGSMRIRGMKGELEDLGEEVDETVDSISKVQTQILNITHGKVNIFDDAGEFRDYYKIMEEIAAVYNDLTSTEQASLSEILFGKNRGNQGAALIQAFQSGQIQKAYETAMNSAGSAAEEQARWMDSLEAEYFASILRNKY